MNHLKQQVLQDERFVEALNDLNKDAEEILSEGYFKNIGEFDEDGEKMEKEEIETPSEAEKNGQF